MAMILKTTRYSKTSATLFRNGGALWKIIDHLNCLVTKP
jgi:hypothetical protein